MSPRSARHQGGSPGRPQLAPLCPRVHSHAALSRGAWQPAHVVPWDEPESSRRPLAHAGGHALRPGSTGGQSTRPCRGPEPWEPMCTQLLWGQPPSFLPQPSLDLRPVSGRDRPLPDPSVGYDSSVLQAAPPVALVSRRVPIPLAPCSVSPACGLLCPRSGSQPGSHRPWPAA